MTAHPTGSDELASSSAEPYSADSLQRADIPGAFGSQSSTDSLQQSPEKDVFLQVNCWLVTFCNLTISTIVYTSNETYE